jgi:drug/metabolite transporter (DMT)-like permease
MKRKNIAKLTSIMLIWAASWIFIKFSLKEIPPFSLAFLRFLIASPVIILIALTTKKRKREEEMKISLKEIPIYSVLALTGVTLLYIVEFFGLEYTTAINASILINLSVIFIALFAFFFFKEKLKKKESLGIIIAFIGTFFIISHGSFLKFMNEKTFLGDMLFIFSAILWTIYSILGKKFLEKKDPLIVTTYTFILGTIFLFPFALYDNFLSYIPEISFFGWLSIFFLAIFCSVIAYVVWFQAMKEEKAYKVAVFIYLIPLFTAILANVFLKEEITPFIVLGGALVIYGVYLTESRG